MIDRSENKDILETDEINNELGGNIHDYRKAC